MEITQLYIHPVKSAAATLVDSIVYSELGPEFDRHWMVVNEEGVFLTQRTLPKMCLIKAKPLPKLNGSMELQLSASGMDDIIAQASNNIVSVKVWNDVVQAIDYGDEAAEWLSLFLGKTSRLVGVADTSTRLVDQEYAKSGQTVGFADGFPTLIVSQASLDQFNSHINLHQLDSGQQSKQAPVDMRRFRPNIVVSGCQPFAEDSWSSIKINGIEFDLVKPCSRCIMPSINPDTGAKEMQINQTLLQTRRRERETYFGQNALHRGTGEISVGDAVELI